MCHHPSQSYIYLAASSIVICVPSYQAAAESEDEEEGEGDDADAEAYEDAQEFFESNADGKPLTSDNMFR